MKYKTLFRLALKVMGVWFVVSSARLLIYSIANIVAFAVSNSTSPIQTLLALDVQQLLYFAEPSIMIGIGLYLFFGGEWIVNKAIPSNKTYCHECGYLLKDLKGTRCPECDTPFKPDSSATS